MLRQDPLRKKRGELNLKNRFISPKATRDAEEAQQPAYAEPVNSRSKITKPSLPPVEKVAYVPPSKPAYVPPSEPAYAPPSKPAYVPPSKPAYAASSDPTNPPTPSPFVAPFIDVEPPPLPKPEKNRQDAALAELELPEPVPVVSVPQPPSPPAKSVPPQRTVPQHAVPPSAVPQVASSASPFNTEILKRELAAAAEANEFALHSLRRAQQELSPFSPCYLQNEVQIQSVQADFQRLSDFAVFQEQQEQIKRTLHRRAQRDSAFAKQQSLLMFPRPPRSRKGDENVFASAAPSETLTNYYLSFEGRGIALNPNETFLDDFYRLGGSLADIQQIVFTKSLPVLAQLKTLFDAMSRDAESKSPLTIFAPKKEIGVLRDMLDGTTGFAPAIEPLAAFNERNDSWCIQYIQDAQERIRALRFQFGEESGAVQFVDALGSDKLFNAEQLLTGSTMTVFAVQTLDDLYWAAAQSKRCSCLLTLFDDAGELLTPPLENGLNTYLGSAVRWMPVDSTLVCDVPRKRFLDAVKASEMDDICWTGLQAIVSASDPAGEERYYFSKELRDTFLDKYQEIVEAFRFQQHRRKGLYFE